MEREKCKLTASIQRAQDTLTTQREDLARARAPRMEMEARCKAMEEAGGRRQRQYILGASRVQAAASHSLRSAESAEVLQAHWRQQQDIIAKHQERIQQLTEERQRVVEERRCLELRLCPHTSPSTWPTTTGSGVGAVSQEDHSDSTLPPAPPPPPLLSSFSLCATGNAVDTASAAMLPVLPPFSLVHWTSLSRRFSPKPLLPLPLPPPSLHGAPVPSNPPLVFSSLPGMQMNHPTNPLPAPTNANVHASLSSAASFYRAQGQQWQAVLMALCAQEEAKKKLVEDLGKQVEGAERSAQTARERVEHMLNRFGMAKRRKRGRDSTSSFASLPERPPAWSCKAKDENGRDGTLNAFSDTREEQAPTLISVEEKQGEKEDEEEGRDSANPMTTMTPGRMEATNLRHCCRSSGGGLTSSSFRCRLCHTDILASFADACFPTTEVVSVK